MQHISSSINLPWQLVGSGSYKIGSIPGLIRYPDWAFNVWGLLDITTYLLRYLQGISSVLISTIHRLNLERLNLEWDFYPNGLNPEWD
jgi:hypothetical protein